MDRLIKGESMHPALRMLDVCETTQATPENLEVGDIVIYRRGGENTDIVHRIVSIDLENKCALIKGDNVGGGVQDKVPLSDITEKVTRIKKEGKVVNLQDFFHKASQGCIAFLSRRNVTPSLIRHRFIDPVLLRLAKTHLYIFFRKMFYKDISYSKSKDGDICRVYAFVNGAESAKAVMGMDKKKGVLIDSYIRYRDRNHFFAEQFMHKILEESDKEFGADKSVYIRDKSVKDLISAKDAFFFNDKVFFK